MDTASNNSKYSMIATGPKTHKESSIIYSSLAKKFLLPILIIRGMTFRFEYPGKFKSIFKMNLGSESGDKVGSVDEKNQKSKISCTCT
jgi:hypothetical protein